MSFQTTAGGILVPEGFDREERRAPVRAQPVRGAQLPKVTRGRSYAGAGHYEELTGWTSTPTTADSQLRQTLRPLVARSRVEARSNPYVKNYLRMLKTNVVGPRGIEFRPSVAGSSSSLDGPANKALRAWFRRLSRKDAIDYLGRRNLRALENLFVTTVAREGEFAGEHIIDPSLPFGYAFRPFDPQLIDVDKNERNGPNVVRLGVEYSPEGRRVAYWIRVPVGHGFEDNVELDVRSRRVPADRILHVYFEDEIDQSRGVPETAASLYSFRSVRGFSQSAIVAARLGANKAGFFQTPTGTQVPADEAFDEDGNETRERTLEFEPGTYRELPEGVEFKAHDPAYPHEIYGPFIEKHLQEGSAGLGVSYNSMANDLRGVNFSSMRSGVQEDRDVYMCWQEFTIDEFLEPLVERALLSSLLMQRVTLENGNPLDTNSFDRYREGFAWQPRRWGWVDPAKDALEKKTLFELGAISRSEITESRARRFEDVANELAEEKRILEAAGLQSAPASTLTPEGAGLTPAGDTIPEGDDDD